MKRLSNFIWPVIALVAMGFSFWLLAKDLKDMSFTDVVASLRAIPVRNYLFAGLSRSLPMAHSPGMTGLA